MLQDTAGSFLAAETNTLFVLNYVPRGFLKLQHGSQTSRKQLPLLVMEAV
jgi:hypothetical protein